jgi:hypothetical protein
VRTSILVPGDYVVPPYANAMPTFKGQLNDLAIDALIGYMQHIDQLDPKTGKLLPTLDPETAQPRAAGATK